MTKTYPLRKSRSKNNRGFSMIEMMLVLALIGIFVTFGAKRLVNKNTKMKSTIRRFAVMVKKLRNKARVQNATYRMVFDFPENKNTEQLYWVESTSQKALLINEEQREELSENIQVDSIGEEVVIDPQGFKPEGAPNQTLPKGLFFDSVEIAGEDSARKSGRIYIYFFPQGFVQESAIHITDREKLNWTLAIHPLTGKVDIIRKYVSLNDMISE